MNIAIPSTFSWISSCKESEYLSNITQLGDMDYLGIFVELQPQRASG